MDVPLLSELPEAVERTIFLALGKAELLACAELGHASLLRSARDNAYWKEHFEKQLRGSLRDVVDGACGRLTYFKRFISTRHLETFRRPPVLTIEGSAPAPLIYVVPSVRHGNTELVLLSLAGDSAAAPRIVLQEVVGGKELVNEELVPQVSQSRIAAAEVVHGGTGATACDSGSLNVKTIAREKRRAKPGKRHSGISAIHATGVENSDNMVVGMTPASAKCPSLQERAITAVERIQGGALFALACEASPPLAGSHQAPVSGVSTIAVRTFFADKWGDAYRGRFVISTALPCPVEWQPMFPAHSDESPVVEEGASRCTQRVLSCAVFGGGRYVAAGIAQLGTLVWDLAGDVGATPLNSALVAQSDLHARRRESKGSCFLCGQSGHWARSCLARSSCNEPTDGGPVAASSDVPSSPASSGFLESCPVLGPQPARVAADLGSVVAVSGVLVPEAVRTSVLAGYTPLVLSASSDILVGDEGGADGGDADQTRFVRRFTIDLSATPPKAALGPIRSLHVVDPGEAVASDRAGSRRLLIWVVRERGISVFSAAADTVDNVGDQRFRHCVMGARALDVDVSAVLPVPHPSGLLCGMSDGRVLHFRAHFEVGCVSAGTSASPSIDRGLVVTDGGSGVAFDSSEAVAIIKCRVLGSGATSKSAAVACLAADMRLPIVLSGGTDGSVKIWDSTSWQCLRTLRFFGQGAIASLVLLVCAPLRGIVVVMEKEPRMRLVWFGCKPALRARLPSGKSLAGSEQTAKKLYVENPGKASTCEDWRGVVANSRKKDIGYGAPEYQHRGASRKERRDLAARVKPQGRESIGIVGSSGGRSAPLFESVDAAVWNTGTTQIAHGPIAHMGQAVGTANLDAYVRGYCDDEGYEDYDEYLDDADQVAWQFHAR